MKRASSIEPKNPFKSQKIEEIQIDTMKPLKFVSYNVASLNACLKKGLQSYITLSAPDILLIQETKLSTEPKEFLLSKSQYPFQFYYHAVAKKGYSGVLVCCILKKYLILNISKG